MADVTVVTPTRNRREVLAQTLACILAQDGVDVRLVVVDEGSTDGTPALLASLAARDARVEVVRHDPPRGLAAARNAGLERASTPWVAFCDDDDLWAPDKLAAQLAALAPGGARWSCVGTVSVDGDRRILGHQRPPSSGDVSRLLRSHNAVPGGGSGLLVDAELLRDAGGYDAWFTGCEDFEVNVRLALRSPLAAVDRPLLAYRVWPGSMSTDVARMRTGHERTVDRWRGELDPDEARAGDLVEEQYLGRFHLRNRDRLGGLRHYVGMARTFRAPRQLVTAVGAAVSPRLLAARHDRREADAVPGAWAQEARRWLDRVPRLDDVVPGVATEEEACPRR